MEPSIGRSIQTSHTWPIATPHHWSRPTVQLRGLSFGPHNPVPKFRAAHTWPVATEHHREYVTTKAGHTRSIILKSSLLLEKAWDKLFENMQQHRLQPLQSVSPPQLTANVFCCKLVVMVMRVQLNSYF
ncbi:hypothetical protein E2C01_041490 [Portunus trituberculatus]|uniref:Uncharacterized protein n=1 Tax=Portunus trituberculatus TaxID=210409 RepID=A0A5B7FTQ1_PORTR|nr:hypothetical protein [Portunus trituberculatus]